MSQRCPTDITDRKGKYTSKKVSSRKGFPGRPPVRYKVNMVKRIMEYYMLNHNASETDLAAFLDINLDTLRRYIKRFPAVRQAVLFGGLHLDTQVARSLYERATGYDVIEKKVVVIKGEDSEIVEIPRHIPANVEAQKYWLSKRNKNWQDKDEVEKFEKDKELIAELLQVNQEDLPE